MRQIILAVLLTLPVATYGQNPAWQLSFHLQPEITFHKGGYPWWIENPYSSTGNMGIASAAQYNISERFFINAGIGFIARRLRSANYLNQAALPPPKQSFTLELVTIKSVFYRVLFFPVNAGFIFLHIDKFNSFVTAGFSGNYLLNTYYRLSSSRYEGAYKKNYWQGYSLIVGLGVIIN